MSGEATASCLCGEVRLDCGRPVGPGSYCHCKDCRKSTGSAFSVAVPFDAAAFRVVCGKTGSFTKAADSGNTLTRHFCLTCGAPMYGTSPQHPGLVYVKAGVLDPPFAARPSHQSWCRSRVEWSRIDPELPAYPGAKPAA